MKEIYNTYVENTVPNNGPLAGLIKYSEIEGLRMLKKRKWDHTLLYKIDVPTHYFTENKIFYLFNKSFEHYSTLSHIARHDYIQIFMIHLWNYGFQFSAFRSKYKQFFSFFKWYRVTAYHPFTPLY